MRDLAILDGVVLAVGIEQVDRDPADLCLPDSRDHVAAADAYRHLHPLTAGIAHRLDRQVAWIGFGIAGVLDAIAVYRLDEVALGIEQSDGDEIQPLIARCLAVDRKRVVSGKSG